MTICTLINVFEGLDTNVCHIKSDLQTIYHFQQAILNTVWHDHFTAIKFYGLPIQHLDKKLMDSNLGKPSFMINVMAIYSRFPSSLQVLFLWLCH